MDWLNPDVLWTFTWKVVNFVVLAAIVVFLVRKFDVFDKVFGGYRRRIQGELEAASRLQQEAEQIKAELEHSIQQAQAQSAQIVEKAKAQSQREKDALVAAAEKETDRLLAQARETASHEIDRQRETIERNVLEQALERARQRLAKQITKKDNEQLVNDFLDRLSEESLRPA